jgi:NADH:ubiquinone oxidoreductase subunit 4 (subunit M)
MTDYSWIIAGLFLPLFPLGMAFNAVFQRIRNPVLRALLLLAWPLAGLYLLQVLPVTGSTGLSLWALLSAVLYGFRAVVVRDVNVWAGYLATSAWSLVWIALVPGQSPDVLVKHVLSFSIPLVLLVALSAGLERRYESAYAGIVSGVAQVQPRLAGLFVATMLAVIGSPLFPGFFAMLGSITRASAVLPLAAAGIALVWLLWSWSGMRLLQELLVGPATATAHADVTRAGTATFVLLLLMLVVGGLYLSGGML